MRLEKNFPAGGFGLGKLAFFISDRGFAVFQYLILGCLPSYAQRRITDPYRTPSPRMNMLAIVWLRLLCRSICLSVRFSIY